MRNISFIIIFIVIVVAITGGYYYVRYFRGAGPAVSSPPEDISTLLDPVNHTDIPLTLPAGFKISVVAKNVPGARDMVQVPSVGDALYVTQTKEGTISRIDIQSGDVETVLTGLNRPHGIAWEEDSNMLYITEQDAISRMSLSAQANTLEHIVSLPSGGRHTNYSLRFGSDDRLYVALGSSCDTCFEKDPRRGTIQVVDIENSTLREFARGLRNATFMAWHPITGEMWVSEMGRDFLGDNLPPDEINIVRQGGNYGWPVCYGKNIHDTDFDTNTYIRNPCMEPFEIPSHINLQAHSAPLGLGFIPRTNAWPEEYWDDLIVAYHGSWNRTVPTGYKLIRLKLDENGVYEGREDFISGWLTEEGALGRPAGVLIRPDGVMYVSDDHAGVMYKITYGSAE